MKTSQAYPLFTRLTTSEEANLGGGALYDLQSLVSSLNTVGINISRLLSQPVKANGARVSQASVSSSVVSQPGQSGQSGQPGQPGQPGQSFTSG